LLFTITNLNLDAVDMARQMVASKRLSPREGSVRAKCDAFDVHRVLRTQLVMQISDPADARAAWSP
jgi:hypothetical protein